MHMKFSDAPSLLTLSGSDTHQKRDILRGKTFMNVFAIYSRGRARERERKRIVLRSITLRSLVCAVNGKAS